MKKEKSILFELGDQSVAMLKSANNINNYGCL